jgi:CHAD domain-containing protein
MESISPGQRVSHCARFALRLRLKLVDSFLDEVWDSKDPSSDVIHQLRVSTRRAAATMDGFKELLPARRAKSLQKFLKCIRKTAGGARDVDVLAKRLSEDQQLQDRWPALIERLEALRRQARRPVAAACAPAQRKDFRRRARRVLRRIAWAEKDGDEPVFAEIAIDKVRAAAEPFFDAAVGDLSSVDRLHQFRIFGKHLRYAMEIFSPAFGPRFRDELYPMLASLQDKLGEINDHAEAIKRFEQWTGQWQESALQEALVELIEEHRTALVQSIASFRNWWTVERAIAWRQRFDEVLSSLQVERVA